MSLKNQVYTNNHPYSLKLASGISWNILATEGGIDWFKKLIAIIGGKQKYNESKNKLIIFRMGSQKGNFYDIITNCLQEPIPPKDWTIQVSRLVNFFTHKALPYIICDIGEKKSEIDDIQKMNQIFLPIFTYSINNGGIPIHSALIERKGLGYLLAAPSGSGKTTCFRRISKPWHEVCDDLTLIVKSQNHYYTHPLPTWSDYIFKNSSKTWNIYRYIPLAGIFFIEQSENDKVLSIRQGEAAIKITELSHPMYQINRPNTTKEEQIQIKAKIFSNAWDLASIVPCHILRCSLTGKFWEEIEKVTGI